MTLEELIYKRLTGFGELTQHLAVFSGVPAVFSPEPPNENQKGWGGNLRYPQIVYSFDLQANEERHSAGTLSVSLLCRNTEDTAPEMLEPLVRKCLLDVILTPAGGMPYCFTWARTESFMIEEKKSSVTIGSEVRFDILEYPSQETSDPDPVMAANKYIKGLYPECMIMGYDRMEEITEATGERPVIYCRLVSADKSEETNTVAWMDGRIAVHILCPESQIRLEMATAIANRMSLDGEIIMLDHSPMFIKRLQVNHKSDYLKDGQIMITGRYGLLRYRERPRLLQSVHVGYQQKPIRNRRCVMAKETLKATCSAQTDEKSQREMQGTRQEKKGTDRTDSLYPVCELAEHAEELFGVRKECVVAALILAGKKEYTVPGAEEIIKKFVRREVR